MDSYASLDCTMLHEFFHTYQGKIREDIPPAYGWETCVDMSHDKSINNAGKSPCSLVYGALTETKENFMFFALGVRMIKNQVGIPANVKNVSLMDIRTSPLIRMELLQNEIRYRIYLRLATINRLGF